jgi:acetoacetate decarboxylase
MGRVRYARSARDLETSARAGGEGHETTVRSIRCVYETDAEVAAAVVPKPLEMGARPEIHLSFQAVESSLAPGEAPGEGSEVCSASFGVGVEYDDKPGIYLLTRPTSAESQVAPSRERFGEPTKLAHFELDLGGGAGGDSVSASAERMGVRYLAAMGRCVEALGPRRLTEYGYCFKAFPGSADGEGFDQDPQLVRLEMHHRFEQVWRIEGGIELWDSPFDPVSDLPVRRVASLEYAVGKTAVSARVLRPVPGEWLRPFLHQRYDTPRTEGLEV